MGSEQEAPVDDVEPNLDQDPGKQGCGNLRRHRTCSKKHQQQHHGVSHARNRSRSARFDVDHCAHRGASTGKA